MDTSWWWALVGVVMIALVAAVVDGRRRGRRPGERTRPPGAPGRPRVRRPAQRAPQGPRGPRRKPPERVPRAGEIWWADVPYEDGPGSKDRPCLVLSVRGDSALIAKITTKHREERPGVIALPAGAVGDARARPSFLETDELREVGVWEFRRRVGLADPTLWGRVRHLAK
ncbi:type II toxin-antitoxin system PemK/MazF family toxin [Streptomyces sp. ISL-98]|uniref:type II toxin-antitoxin system PemK/MazF family toxin n=1 Tax=Streptomyces sp. ISL-98 TaxID=2819192 RepID=UPI001BEC3D62|nr:type II toxin-antitoxin system PemK/MazF family toxin [Streptomyces sp. ISL-98]MBT2508136.1 type II toxin-antitoxin system PemK/MazF family toxin [Streptomyces sp. ISL-98]